MGDLGDVDELDALAHPRGEPVERRGRPERPGQALERRARPMLRTFGAVSSRWYLLFSPLAFALAWLGILVVALAR